MFTEKLAALYLGFREFRSCWTTHYDDDLLNTYDTGREWAHKLTLRYFEAERKYFGLGRFWNSIGL